MVGRRGGEAGRGMVLVALSGGDRQWWCGASVSKIHARGNPLQWLSAGGVAVFREKIKEKL